MQESLTAVLDTQNIEITVRIQLDLERVATRMKNAPNIFLIVLDTVRPDHLSCYGYSRNTSPNIDDLAKKGVMYENAFSAAPWTPESHASIFTGKYPSHHRTIGKDVRFREGNTSLAEVLSSNGYHTYGITGCQILGPGSGFEKGFQQFKEVQPPSISRFTLGSSVIKDFIMTLASGPDKGASQTIDMIKNFVRKDWKRKDPFFIFVNFFGAHTPYDPRRPYKRTFCPSFDQPKFYIQEYLFKLVSGKTAERINDSNLSIRRLNWVASGGGGFSFAAKEISVSEREWDIVKSWYDGEIAYLDNKIGELISFLRDEAILDDTLLVITSDHGENFGEHGLAVHPLCVYDSLLHVPLILHNPQLVPRGKRILNLTSTIDLFPTLMDLAKLERPADVQGESLYPFERKEGHEFVCAEYGGLHTKGFAGLKAWKLSPSTKEKLAEIDRGCKCVRTLTHKYILTEQGEELYDVQKDPSEENNIVKQHREIATAMRRQLEKTVDTSYFGPKEFSVADEKEKDMMKRLRSLGYI